MSQPWVPSMHVYRRRFEMERVHITIILVSIK